jgi:hypothetical protein
MKPATHTLSRTSFDSGVVFVEEIPPGVDDVAATVWSGFAPGRVELLRSDCSVIAAWPLPQAGGDLVIASDGSGRFYPADADDAADSPPPLSPAPSGASPRLVRSVLRCGATETVPPETVKPE